MRQPVMQYCLIGSCVAGICARSGACDLCALYAASEAQGAGKGFFAGVAEQFTHFGTLQENGHEVPNEGQYIDSSVSQLLAGYNFNNRFGVQLNLPVIYRSWGSHTLHGLESGIGDLSLVGNFTAYRTLAQDYNFTWTLLGGIKFPTGDSSRLSAPDSAFPDGIAGHDLALGSGSYDGVVGTGVSGRWKRFFATASLQYAIRSEGEFQHQYANDLTWFGGPGAFLVLSEKATLAAQFVVSGETKGKDTFAGVPDEDSAGTCAYLGPQISVTWGARLAAQLGLDVPVHRANSGLQVVPDYRVRAAVTLKF